MEGVTDSANAETKKTACKRIKTCHNRFIVGGLLIILFCDTEPVVTFSFNASITDANRELSLAS